MRCGTKQFIVTYENEEKKTKEESLIYARTPADARKQLRLSCGKDTTIYTVRERQ